MTNQCVGGENQTDGGRRTAVAAHFGNPCIHCGIAHDECEPGACSGAPSKAVPISYRVLNTRYDGVAEYLVRYSDMRVETIHSHVSNHLPYYHFGKSDDLIQPPRYDGELTLSARPLPLVRLAGEVGRL